MHHASEPSLRVAGYEVHRADSLGTDVEGIRNMYLYAAVNVGPSAVRHRSLLDTAATDGNSTLLFCNVVTRPTCKQGYTRVGPIGGTAYDPATDPFLVNYTFL
jgi:hypothetical protein